MKFYTELNNLGSANDKKSRDVKTILLAAVLLLGTVQSIKAAGPIEARIVLTGPMLVGFFPPVTKAELDDHMSDAAEGMAHVEFALVIS